MLRWLIPTVLLLCSITTYGAGSDYIIFRDGSLIPGQIIQTNNNYITVKIPRKIIKEISGNEFVSSAMMSSYDDVQQRINPLYVYLLHYKERGNVYVKPDGKRITGENLKINPKCAQIYLTDGAQIQAFNVRIGENIIEYTSTKPKKIKDTDYRALSPADVFMIIYPDGYREIISNIIINPKEETAATDSSVAPSETATQTDTSKNDEEERQVVFHNVKRGETLDVIATKYGVSVADIKEWNDLPAKLTSRSRLTQGTQLMIYK